MAISINLVRVSMVWTQTYFNLIAAKDLSGYPYNFLGRSPQYRDYFLAIKENKNRAGNLDYPWSSAKTLHFWTYYLKNLDVTSVSYNEAWNSLVPFRGKSLSSATVKTANGDVPLILEAYYYPFGSALAISADLAGVNSLPDMVDAVHQLRFSKTVLSASTDAQPADIKTLAIAELKSMRDNAIGAEGMLGGTADVDPFTLVTVLDGDGVNPNENLLAGSPIHQALQALTSWSASWKDDTLLDFDTRKLTIRKRSPLGNALFGDGQGQVVWCPALFKNHKTGLLRFYHRNLLLANLHAQSLLSLLHHSQEWKDAGRGFTAIHSWYIQRALTILSPLYHGPTTTYRSWSLKAHIGLHKDELNKIREKFLAFGLPEF
jgi:hypothetical protein